MNRRNLQIWITLLCCIQLFTECKKEIGSKDYKTGVNVLGNLGMTGVQLLTKPDGSGYMIVYTDNDNYERKLIGVAIADNNCNIISKNIISSDKCVNGFSHCLDDKGNLYICGSTRNAALKMDKSIFGSNDAYLAKVDPNGKLLWERGYCDTLTARKGIGLDEFYQVYFINNKLYCIGASGSFHTPISNALQNYATWLVIFDQNGNKLNQKIIPGIVLNDDDLNNAGGDNWEDAIKLKNNDLLFRSAWTKASTVAPYTSDSLVTFSRYSTSADSVVWTRYYLRSSPQADISNFGELPNGNIMCFNSYYSLFTIIDPNNGNVLAIDLTGFTNTGSGTAYNSYNVNWGLWSYTLEDGLYIPGSFRQGENYRKPWLMKFDRDGKLIFSRIYDLSNANFNSLVKNKDGHIQLIGNNFKAGTRELMSFVLTVDKDGNILTP